MAETNGAYEHAFMGMVQDGWLMHGTEGMSETQELVYKIYQVITGQAIATKEGEQL